MKRKSKLPIWEHRNKKINSIEDFPKDVIGFVYEILFSNGKKYIGKKVLFHKRTLKPLKGKKRRRVQIKESDWKTYYGSIKNEEFRENYKLGNITVVSRRILKMCYDKTDLTYQEVKHQFKFNVLEKEGYLNSNILGKFYKCQNKSK